MDNEEKLNRKLARQIKAREEAEMLLEVKVRESYLMNIELKKEAEILARKNQDLNLFLAMTNLADQDFNSKKYLTGFISKTCEIIGWPLGHIYLIKNDVLIPSEIWYKENTARFDDFIAKTKITTFKSGEGLPGRCFQEQVCIIIEDLMAQTQLPRINEMRAANLVSALAVPIFLGGKVFAVAEFYLETPIRNDNSLIVTLNNAVKQLGLLLARRKFEKELCKKNKTLSENFAKLEQMQIQLVQSEKMASLGQLAAGVAHEINNPIGYVNGNIDAISEYLQTFKNVGAIASKLNTAPDEHSKQILCNELISIVDDQDFLFILQDLDLVLDSTKNGLKRVKDIVDNLKAFSRVDSQLEYEETNINYCIESTLKIVTNEIKYHCEIIKSLGEIPVIMANAGQINQVILNLLVNAGQAITGRGTITICTFTESDYIVLKISDTGCGMSEDVVGKIFDPFFTTKPVGKGTGLGLSLTHGIISKHNGTIEVNSVINQGTDFIIKLPINVCKLNIR